MDLQFRKDLLPYLKTVINETQSKEQTQEVRLPEEMPDIGHVITSWGQVLIRSKEWHPGGIGVSGGVMVWVMYAPENGARMQCIETWLPFQFKREFENPEKDGIVCAIPLLTAVDARSTSARKLIVRVGVDLQLQAKIKTTAELYQPEELPDDVCLLKNIYPMVLPAECGEKAFSLEEELTFPSSELQLENFVYYNIWPQVTERKMLTDKLLFRGTVSLRVLYLDSEGALCSWGTEVPFSQYTELEHDYSDDVQSVIHMVTTNLELDKVQEGKCVLKAGLLAQYTIYDRTEIGIVEDAYSTKNKLIPEMSTVNLPSVLDAVQERVVVRPTEEVLHTTVMDMAFYPSAPEVFRDETGICTEIRAAFCTLGGDDEGQLCGKISQWNDIKKLPSDPGVKVNAVAWPVCVEEKNGDWEALMQLETQVISNRELPVISGISLEPSPKSDLDRPTLILCRCGEKSLWELAKSVGATVESIREINALTQEPDPQRLLLIPVP